MMNMKTISALFLCLLFFSVTNAQDETEDRDADPMKGKFRRDNIFLGGSLGAGFTSGSFSVGANPEIGYTVASWMDAGLGFNINYSTISADYNDGYSQRAFSYGGGPFVRLYPISFLFVQGQLEENWTNYHLKNVSTGQTGTLHTKATSLLGGIGYTQRTIGSGSYYLLVAMDFLRNDFSPYLDNTYGQKRIIPIIRAGFNFYLKPRR